MTEVLFGLPDRAPEEVLAYVGRLAGRLGHDGPPGRGLPTAAP
ncbi:MAG: hypothetical protein ACR2FU_14370 [Streptosporangiaceae bacterium]